jgi:hypothetical protein
MAHSTYKMRKMNNFIKLIEKELYSHNTFSLEFIQKQIELLFNLIKETKDIDEAEMIFGILGEIQFVLARAIFKDKLGVNQFLRQFVYDFDRIDDGETKIHLFNKIKSLEY